MKSAAGQKTLFVQILLSLCVLLALIVPLLSLALGAAYERSSRDILESSSRQILAQVSHSLERFDVSARTYAVALLATNPVIRLMNSASLEPWDAVRTLDTIRAQLASDSSVASVYIYNRAQDCFYTTVGNGIQKRSSFFDAEVAALLEAPEGAGRLRPVPRRVPPASEGSTGGTTSVYSYFLWEALERGESPSSCVIVNISARYVMETVRSEAQARVVVVDAAGRAVGPTEDESFLGDLSDVEPYRQVIAAREPTGSFVHAVEGERELVTFATIPRTGWRLLRTEPYRSVTRPLAAVRLLVVLISLAFLLCGAGLAVLLSRRLSSPVRDLARRVRYALAASRPVPAVPNELLYLSQAFTETVDSVNLLRRFRDSNLRLLREELLRGLLGGTSYEPTDLAAKLVELDLPFDIAGSFVCVALKMDREGEPAGPVGRADHLLYGSAAAKEMLRSAVGLEHPCEIVERESGCYVLVVGWTAAPTRASLAGRLLPAVAAAQAGMRSSLGVSFSAACSWPARGVEHLAELGRQAEDLLGLRFVEGPGCLIGPWEERGSPAEAAAFPVEREAELVAAVREGDAVAARRAYEACARLIERQPYEGIMLSLTRLASTIFDFVGMVESNSDLRFPVRFSTFMRELQSCETLGGAGRRFAALIDTVCATERSLVTQKQKRNVEVVKQIVAERYRDRGLCATSIADSMGMSAVYLGKIFRDACRCSIAEYLTGYRVERARELLDRRDRTVKEIAEEVGIERPRFLFTKFRERFGATPTAYRLRRARVLDAEPTSSAADPPA